MKRLLLFVLPSILAFAACTSTTKYKTSKHTDANGFKYETVSNDPLSTRIYTLDNGLTVYLTPNPDEPRATCLIGVRAGSTSDPKETTGLAHYFEHMMFKGTTRMGTTNWAEESILIDKIEQLYEQHRATTDPAEKKAIYHQIDSISQEAAKYVATNEYDKLMASIGTKGSNAGTSYESTIYINDVPVNELEKWAKIESERFHGIVLRLFHTELEAVYEEFNMYQDRDDEREFQALMATLFPGHPYGRNIIGYPEDLKNPSMINIQKFYNEFYVPNNMAIVISGDIDFDKTIQIVSEYFGDLKPKELPQREKYDLEPITEVITKDVVGPEPENVIVAYRMGGIGSEDQPYCDVINMLLNNNQAGLMDLNLVQQQKVLWGGSFYFPFKDYGIQGMQAAPLEGQTLEEVTSLAIAQIDSIKQGKFDDWLIQAVINDLKLQKIRSEEKNSGRAYELMNEYTSGLSREQSLAYMNTLNKITKVAVVAFANDKYSDNYVVINKRQGDNAKLVKVEKPAITPVPVNRDLESDFAKEFKAMKGEEISPVFVDFNKKISSDELQDGCNFYYIKNELNDLFALRYIIEMGSWNDLKFELAVGYLKFIGTNEYSAPDFQKELYKYGLELNVSTDEERSYVTIRGLNESFDKGVELLEHIIDNAKPDEKAYQDYVGRIMKDRADQKAEQSTILWDAMYSYGVYGSNSPKKNILSEDELNAINPAELTDLLKKMTTYKHDVFYYGPENELKVKELLKKEHKLPEMLADVPAPKEFNKAIPEENKVYVVDFDINQANILMVGNGDVFSKDIMPYARIYNEYYGGEMSSIVFQEIRESKALAYSAYSGYRMASKVGRRNTLLGYLGTQSDKLSIATSTLIDLLNQMPRAEEQYKMACESIVKKINTERITKENIFWTWQRNMDRGLDYDVRKDEYEAAKTTSIDEFEKFFNSEIKGQKFTYLILGNKKSLDNKALQSLGKVEDLSLEEIFGY